MASIDLAPFLAPISADRPCGENKEYDGIGALETAAQGTPEQQVGTSVVPAQGADWKKVVEGAGSLSTQTHDLRLVLLLTRGWLRLHGVIGLVDGLELLCETLDRFWDGVHPELDPSDANDPTQRLNIIGGLCDQAEVINPLRAAPILAVRGFGRFSLRDVLVAAGDEPAAAGAPVPEKAALDAAFEQAELPALEAVRDAAGKGEALLTRINDLIGERTGQPSLAPDFTRLSTALGRIQKVVDAAIERRGGAPGAAAEGGPADDGHDLTVVAARPRNGGRSGVSAPGEIRSVDDVTRALDAICAYYAAYEPSSPVPMVLRRARRLVGLNFLEIMNDLLPSAVEQLTPFRGPESES